MSHLLSRFLSRGALSLGCVLLCIGSTAYAVPGDEHWDARFGWPGPGGLITAVAQHNGRIYTGSQGTTNTPLMVWDGAQWNVMSTFSGSPTIITDLKFMGDTLFAAGQFTNVDGVAANGLAKWDGTNWSAIGFKGSASCLAVDGSNLYVSGIFSTNANGLLLNDVALWDGANWHAMGNGLGSASVGTIVYSVIATNGVIYAGGTFTNSGPAAVTNVAQWDGANWQPLAGGPGGTPNSLLLNGGILYAGGFFGTSIKSAVAQWDGSNWTLVGSGFDTAGVNVLMLNNQLCISGAFTNASGIHPLRFAVWNGTSWTNAGSGLSSTAQKAISTGTNILVGGSFLQAGGQVVNGLASWDGANWSSVGVPGRSSGISTTVRAIASDGTNVYVGGAFTAAGQTNANYIARFDGTNWYSLGSGIGPVGVGSTVVNALSVTNGNLYVGGYFSTAGGVSAANAAMWDGTNWHGFSGSPGGIVYTIAARPDGVYASGTYYTGTQYGAGYLTRWDGNEWTNVIVYDGNNYFEQFPLSTTVGLFTFAFWGTDLYVSGAFGFQWHDPTLTFFTNSANILRFDGTYARVVDGGLGGTNANAMVVFQNQLYVGGPFTTAGSNTASGLASWDGSAWHNAIGGGIVGNGTVDCLAADNSYLYVGGTFTNLGGQSIARIAKWDGANWSALGSGVSSTVLAACVAGSDLYVGGTLRVAGGKSSQFFGHWNSQSNYNVPTLINPAWPATNRLFHARLFGVPNVTNIVEASTDLHSWSGILTNTNGVYDFTDTNSSAFSRRYYRAGTPQ